MTAIRSGPPAGERLTGLASVGAVAIGVVITLEFVRIWLPSLWFVAGDSGETFSTPIAAAAWPVIAAIVIVPLAARWPGPRLALYAATGLVAVTRFGLQATAGGDPQLTLAAAGVLSALVWVGTVAAGAVARPATGLGLVAGLLLDATLHAGLGGIGLVWRGGVAAWLAVAVLVALFAAAAVVADDGEAAPGGALSWIAAAPALAVSVAVGSVPRLHVVAGTTETSSVVVVAGAYLVAGVAVVVTRRLPSRQTAVVAAACALLGLSLTIAAPMPFESGIWSAVGQATLLFGLAFALGTVGWAGGLSGPVRRASGFAAGIVVGAFVVAGSSGASGWPLTDTPALWFGTSVAAAAVLASRPPTLDERLDVNTGRRPGAVVLATLLLATAVATGVVARTGDALDTIQGDGFPVRVMSYDLHAGYDVAGRLAVDRLAHVIADHDPDIVALREVERGRFVTGTVDVLDRLSHQTGLPFIYAPSSDPLQGGAILSRFPVARVQIRPLGDESGSRRQAISLLAGLGNGRRLGVVAADLPEADDAGQRRADQAAVLASMAADFTGAHVPVVVLAGLGTTPSASELEPLRRAYVNLSPHGAPILASPGLAGSRARTSGAGVSDRPATSIEVAPAVADADS